MTILTERGSSTVNSLKNGALNVRRTRESFSNSESANCVFDRFCSAISRKPSLPSSVRCTVAASAQSAWFVQMFEVAFSRRMCCSRVASVSTNPRWPSESVVCPASRPGIWADKLVPRSNHARERPAVTRGSPKLWPSIATMSASAGGLTRPRRHLPQNRDDEHRTSRCVKIRERRIRFGSRRKVGDCTTTAATSSFRVA